MRALVIDDVAKAKVAKVLAYAEEPRHFYVVGPGGKSWQKTPGDNPQHVAHLDTFRCVFSITKSDGKTWRHLSISVPSEKYPNPFAAYTIAEMFGFTGWDGKSQVIPAEWLAKISEEEHCIVIAQELPAPSDLNHGTDKR
jgi:hypothetical protein